MSAGAPQETSEIRHATSLAIGETGVLITGPSGSGKSALALELFTLGAELIADDHCPIRLEDGWPILTAPPRLVGVIEARGVGLVRVRHRAAALLNLIVDMGETETERMPRRRTETVLGVSISRIRRVDGPHFPGSIVAIATGGFWQP